MNVESKPVPTFTLPDMSTITDMQHVQLLLSSKLLNQSNNASVLNDLHSSSLLFGQLCDDSCKVNLDGETLLRNER